MSLHTVARMNLTMPDGRTFEYTHDFGPDFDPVGAYFMFMEGNYSCDCNLSQFLCEEGHDVVKMSCGSEINVTNLVITTQAIN